MKHLIRSLRILSSFGPFAFVGKSTAKPSSLYKPMYDIGVKLFCGSLIINITPLFHILPLRRTLPNDSPDFLTQHSELLNSSAFLEWKMISTSVWWSILTIVCAYCSALVSRYQKRCCQKLCWGDAGSVPPGRAQREPQGYAGLTKEKKRSNVVVISAPEPNKDSSSDQKKAKDHEFCTMSVLKIRYPLTFYRHRGVALSITITSYLI